jgi:hypothetical protein
VGRDGGRAGGLAFKGGLVWRDNGGASRAFRSWDVASLC